MNQPVVLAAVDDSTAAGPVLAVGTAMAALLDDRLDAIHVRETGRTATAVASQRGVVLRELHGDPVEEIVAAAREPGVELVVAGMRGQPSGPRPIGHVALAVLEQVDAPVLVVPPEYLTDGEPVVERVLVPLEGTHASSDAVAELLDRLCRSGAEVVAVHVFDATTAPAFWGAPGHAEQIWADEFVSRWCVDPAKVDLRLRRGPAPETILEVAEAEQVDLIVLSWSRQLRSGTADVVRGALTHARVPVLLVPAAGTFGPAAGSAPEVQWDLPSGARG